MVKLALAAASALLVLGFVVAYRRPYVPMTDIWRLLDSRKRPR